MSLESDIRSALEKIGAELVSCMPRGATRTEIVYGRGNVFWSTMIDESSAPSLEERDHWIRHHILARIARTTGVKMHPSTEAILKFFKFDHLPPRLQAVSKPFSELALQCSTTLDGPELTVCLRKLLEAKDCAVRAALSKEEG